MNVAEQTGAVLQNTSPQREHQGAAGLLLRHLRRGRAGWSPTRRTCRCISAPWARACAPCIRSRGATLRPGDVVALNNPYNGGTHLPDVTVITPVFDDAGSEILFFVGSRGHHADIGGLTPGSTPPDIAHAGGGGRRHRRLPAGRGGPLPRGGVPRAAGRRRRYPARSPDVNVADIKAQVAANEKGVQELRRAVARVRPRHGARLHAPRHGQRRGERPPRARPARRRRVRDHASTTARRCASRSAWTARARRATIDFTGTGPQRPGNFNAPAAVCRAVVLYCFRALVGEDIPLNDGCLKPLEHRGAGRHLPVAARRGRARWSPATPRSAR